MSLPPCKCCDEPPCPFPWLEVDAISASKSKSALCGFPEMAGFVSTPAKRYLIRTTVRSTSVTYIGGGTESFTSTQVDTYTFNGGVCSGPVTTYSGSASLSIESVSEDSFEDGCTVTYTKTQTASATQNNDGSWTGSKATHIACESTEQCGIGTCGGYPTDTSESWGPSLPTCSPVPTSATHASCVDDDPQGTYSTFHEEATTTLSSEFVQETTAALIARTVAALPAYDGAFNDSGGSSRNLSSGETSYTLRRVKWRIRHDPTGTCYYKVWPRKVFQPEGGGSPTLTDLTPYVWNGTGNPCLPDPTAGVTDEANYIRGTATELMEPSTDGEITIEVVKWSCVPGYEPVEGVDPNGYPYSGE